MVAIQQTAARSSLPAAENIRSTEFDANRDKYDAFKKAVNLMVNEVTLLVFLVAV